MRARTEIERDFNKAMGARKEEFLEEKESRFILCFRAIKKTTKVHDLVWRLIETQGIKRFYEWVIAGLIITPIVRALTILSVFGALVATSVGLAFVYGIYRIINRLSKPKKRV